MDRQAYAALATRMQLAFRAKLDEEALPGDLEDSLLQVCLPLAAGLHRQKQPGQTWVLGVNGAQGSGKSTLSQFLQLTLREAYGYNVAGFSLDDLYLSRAERLKRARAVHPLFATRGVPGTHDVALGLRTLAALRSPGPTIIPAFDKATDEPRPVEKWPQFLGPADVVVFEGWCVGSRPQDACELLAPVNELERREDPFGTWRRYVNRQLAGAYAELFAQLDGLVFLQVPSLDCVFRWRGLQEQKLAAKTTSADKPRLMDAQALRRFIMHYERLTRHNLADLPGRAGLTLYVDENHRFIPPIHSQP